MNESNSWQTRHSRGYTNMAIPLELTTLAMSVLSPAAILFWSSATRALKLSVLGTGSSGTSVPFLQPPFATAAGGHWSAIGSCPDPDPDSLSRVGVGDCSTFLEDARCLCLARVRRTLCARAAEAPRPAIFRAGCLSLVRRQGQFSATIRNLRLSREAWNLLAAPRNQSGRPCPTIHARAASVPNSKSVAESKHAFI